MASRITAKKALPVILVAAGVVVVLVLLIMPSSARRPEPQEEPPVPVKIERVCPLAELPDRFILPAVVQANRVVRVSAEVAGRIEKLSAKEGRKVRRGDLLVTLNADVLQARFDQAAAQRQFDRQEFDRYAALRESGAATDNELDVARTKLAVSKAAFTVAEARLKRTKIRAPITGTLNSLPAEMGEYAREGDVVAEIVDIETAKVVVEVPERDVGFLDIADEAEIFFTGRGTENLKGTISYISELADDQTRTTRVEISVDNRERPLPGGRRKRPLRSGQIVNVRLTRRVLKDVILIPLAVVIPVPAEREGRMSYIVYVVEDGLARKREVELDLDLIQGRKVRVTGGLKEGDKLIVSGHRYVSDAQKVNVRPADETGAATMPAASTRPATGAPGGATMPAPPSETVK